MSSYTLNATLPGGLEDNQEASFDASSHFLKLGWDAEQNAFFAELQTVTDDIHQPIDSKQLLQTQDINTLFDIAEEYAYVPEDLREQLLQEQASYSLDDIEHDLDIIEQNDGISHSDYDHSIEDALEWESHNDDFFDANTELALDIDRDDGIGR